MRPSFSFTAQLWSRASPIAAVAWEIWQRGRRSAWSAPQLPPSRMASEIARHKQWTSIYIESGLLRDPANQGWLKNLPLRQIAPGMAWLQVTP